MNANLKTLVQVAGEHAKVVLVGLGKSLMPTWVLIDTQGRVTIMATPWRDDAEKLTMKRKMRETMRKRGTVAYSFVSEAWTVTRAPGWTPEAEPNFVRPMDDPKRREVVIAIATDGKEREGGAWAIERDENERVRALVPVSDIGGEFLGSMAEMLD